MKILFLGYGTNKQIWVVCLLACGNQKAEFASDVAACELRPTCAEAVQCRKDVAVKHGRDPETTVGKCVPK